MVVCPFCPRKFAKHIKMEQHIEKTHRDGKIRKRLELQLNACPLCGKEFKNVFGVITHVRKSADNLHKRNYELIKSLYIEKAEKEGKVVKVETGIPLVKSYNPHSIFRNIFKR